MRVSTYQTIGTDEILAERYHIKKRLGSGNMGEVYQALDLEHGRLVAIKRIHPHLVSDVDAIQRFQREAKALSRLNHPGIVKFHDFYVAGGAYFIVINYLDGQTLEEKLEEAKTKGKLLPLEEIKTIVLQLCDALAYAHWRGIVHRDLKPANVMISPQGHAILMDFGIAKLLDGEQLTGDGLSPGTPGYMSPEMIRGRAIDGRADIYTMGIILYEMITGQRPFQRGSRYDTMHSHLFETAPDVRKFNPAVPHELAILITQALAKEPEARFQTADELGGALRDVAITPGRESGWHNGVAAADPEPPRLVPLTFIEAQESIAVPLPYPEVSTPTEPAAPILPERAPTTALRPLKRPPFAWLGMGFGMVLLCLLAVAWGVWGLNGPPHEEGVVDNEPVPTGTLPLLSGETLPLLSPEPGEIEVLLLPESPTKEGATPTLAPTPSATRVTLTIAAAASHTPSAPDNSPSQATATRRVTLPSATSTATRTPPPPANTPIPTVQPTATAQPLPTATRKIDSTPMPTPTPTPWIDAEPTKKKGDEDR